MQQMELMVFAHNCQINLAMKAWLDRWHIVPYFKGLKHSLVSARNEAVRDFLERGSAATHLIMFDNNVWPNQSTDAILSSEGDAIYLGHVATSGKPAHFGEETMATACCRFSRAALQDIQPPWFAYTYDDMGIEWITCECDSITKNLISAGYCPKMVGTVPHAVEMIAEMGPSGKMRFCTKEAFLDKFISAQK